MFRSEQAFAPAPCLGGAPWDSSFLWSPAACGVAKVLYASFHAYDNRMPSDTTCVVCFFYCRSITYGSFSPICLLTDVMWLDMMRCNVIFHRVRRACR